MLYGLHQVLRIYLAEVRPKFVEEDRTKALRRSNHETCYPSLAPASTRQAYRGLFALMVTAFSSS